MLTMTAMSVPTELSGEEFKAKKGKGSVEEDGSGIHRTHLNPLMV